MTRLLLAAVVVGISVLALTDVPAAYLFAPLLGLFILRFGLASFGSLRAGASHIPSGPAVRVDPRSERVVYWCAGCGAELLLLARGTPIPPRHCGEKMTERLEVPNARAPGSGREHIVIDE
jgi:DNA-directed RNA polymerase subunit RPC12/RpoP